MRGIRVIAALAFITLIVLFISAQIGMQKIVLDPSQYLDEFDKAIPPIQKSIAQTIVQKTYSETYAILEEECRNVASLQACMSSLRGKDYSIHRFPWWFRTMLRDSTDRNVLHAGWHNITLTKPNLQICAIEKIGCTEWKRLQCEVHEKTKTKGVNCGPEEMPKERPPRAVILRDPLERFLSAFTDKCIKRVGENHCEPLDVFFPTRNMSGATRQDRVNFPDLGEELKTNEQLFFESYVDTMPLRWNVHFFPMGL